MSSTGITVLSIICILAIVIGAYYKLQNIDLNFKLHDLESASKFKESVLMDEVNKLTIQLNEQNEAIDKYRSTIANMNRTISEYSDKLDKERSVNDKWIEEELSKDSSDKKKLELIDKVLHDFSDINK